MVAPKNLDRQVIPTTFRHGDTIRVNTAEYTRQGIAQWSEHVVWLVNVEYLILYPPSRPHGYIAAVLARDCSFVQRASVMSPDRHREEEILGGGHCVESPSSLEQLALDHLRDHPKDMVNLPGHYARFPIEPIRFVVENAAAFKDPRVAAIMAHVIPYLLRHEFKGGIQDLEKAIRLLHMLIKLEQGDLDWWKADRPEQPKGSWVHAG